MGYQPEPLDFDSVDEWAVNIVVREGAFINLNGTEKIVAVARMKELNLGETEIADRLHCEIKDVDAMFRRWRRIGERLYAEYLNLHQSHRSAVH